MADYISLEIQEKIIKRLPIRSLMQFRSVSKTWRSLIDSHDFVTDHFNIQKTHPPLHHICVHFDGADVLDNRKLVSYVDDYTFPQHNVSVTLPLPLRETNIIGCSHGLLCLYGGIYGRRDAAYLWNISIRKGVEVLVPNVGNGLFTSVLGFGVCGTDPKIVKITHFTAALTVPSAIVIPWQVEVFTLSTGSWRMPYNNLPRKSIYFDYADYSHVVTDEFLYWLTFDRDTTDDGSSSLLNLIISFDMMTEKFREINLPSILARVDGLTLSLFKQSESLVVVQISDDLYDNSVVWMMEDGAASLFKKLYTVVGIPPKFQVLGFRMNGAPIVEVWDADRDHPLLVVYEPYTERIHNLWINDLYGSSFVYPYYMETLLLHDQPNMVFNLN